MNIKKMMVNGRPLNGEKPPRATGTKADIGGLICGGLFLPSIIVGFSHPPWSWPFVLSFLVGLPTLIEGIKEMQDIQLRRGSIYSIPYHPMGGVWVGMMIVFVLCLISLYAK